MTIRNYVYNPKDFGIYGENAKYEIKYVQAKDVEEGDRIIFDLPKKFRYFVVDYIEIQFIDSLSDEISDAIEKDESLMKDEYNKYEFIYEDNGGSNGLSIQEIPYNATFLIVRKID